MLIPLFFVLHGFVENFGLVTITDGVLLLATCIAGVAAVYAFAYCWFRNPIKASLITAYLCGIYFFFGAIYDFLKEYTELYKYRILLPIFTIFFIFSLIYLKKNKQHFYKITIFLNVLLSVYLLLDLINLSRKMLYPNPDELSVYNFKKNDFYRPCSSCAKPDIYFLLFDEYSSTRCLQQYFHYDNSALDTFLMDKGFYMQFESKSNYNFTSFSMASILNMDYLRGIRDVNAIKADDYAACDNLISDNSVTSFLSSQKYSIINYSIFDLAGHPSLVAYSLLPVKTRLITGQTLLSRFMRDVAWNLYSGPFEIKWLAKNIFYENLNDNNQFLELVKKESKKKTTRPRFIYAHFEMPHRPFFYDKTGRLRSREELIAETKGIYIESYKNYLPYVNTKIMELITTIKKNTCDSAVIIVMGDHGYRVALHGVSNDHFFQNLNAVYFPGKNYTFLKDSVSGVNQFRMIFNSLFRQSFPLLKDSSVFLTDAH